MKRHEKFLSFLAVLAAIPALFTPSSAFDPKTTSTDPLSSIAIGDHIGNCIVVDVQCHKMTEEEIISYLVTEKGHSLEDALNQVSMMFQRGISITTRTITVNATDDLGLNNLIELGCRVKEANSGGRSNFSEILDSWTGIVSSGIQSWNEFTHSAEIVGAKKVSIDYYARGTIDVAISDSVSQGFSIQVLESLGYSIERTVGTTYYVRKVVDLEGSYTLPGYTYP